MTAPTESRSSPPTLLEETEPLSPNPIPADIQIPRITISPPSPDVSTVASSAEDISVFIAGGPRSSSSASVASDVYELVCLCGGDEDPEPPDSEVRTLYVNGSWQTHQEAVQELLYISEVRGEAVRLLYNDGSGMSSWPISPCRTLPTLDHPLCQALLMVWEQFFSAPENQNREFLVIFYGDASPYIQQALTQSRHSPRIVVVGISPTVFIQGDFRVHNYRVSGDFFSSLDCRGTRAENTTILPYSSGLEGVFLPSIRCPSFTWAVRFGEQCLVANRGEDVEDRGGLSQDAERSQLPHSERDLAVVIDSTDPSSMSRLVEWLNQGSPSSDMEINPYPQRCPDVALSALYAISRVSGLVQEWILASVHEGLDLRICYSLILMHTTFAVRYFFLLFTNYPQSRERFRTARIVAQSLYLPSILVLVFDYGNVLRKLWMPQEILRAIFISASTISGSIVFVECTRWMGRGLRHRVQQFVQQRVIGSGLPVGTVRASYRDRAGFIIGFLQTVHGGLFLPVSIMVLNQIAIQVPRILVRPNNTAVYDLHNKSAEENWSSGDVLAVGQTLNFILCAFVLFVNLWFFVKSVLRHSGRRRR